MISLQSASRSFMRMGIKPLNQQIFSARNFCAAPTIAEKIQVTDLILSNIRVINTVRVSNVDIMQAMVDAEKVVVFMKGVPEAPQCGFSNAVCICRTPPSTISIIGPPCLGLSNYENARCLLHWSQCSRR